MRVIAFYFPQFHSIPENDMWWGNGFTDWTKVKAAVPQYKGHQQPEVPYQKNYYTLLNPEIQVQQAKLAEQYGVDGFCYYHYWFEGKLLLEKPMENMLNNREIRMPFCISWANETWARTWDGQEDNILIQQNYNEDRAAWKRHFDYLLPFFQDERYITHEGKPMFLMYKPQFITECAQMISYWKELAVEAGFPGLYVGYQHHTAFNFDMEKCGLDFGVEFEPFYTVREFKKEIQRPLDKVRYLIRHPKWFKRKLAEKIFRKPVIFDYDLVWERILNRTPEKKNVMPGAFPAWDNTPRRGNYANIFRGASPEKFQKYYAQRVTRAKEVYHAEYLFINAWNEWAEGAHLEPDEVNGFGYLEALTLK